MSVGMIEISDGQSVSSEDEVPGMQTLELGAWTAVIMIILYERFFLVKNEIIDVSIFDFYFV